MVTPRRADTTAVIGSALLASTRGTGYRRIAAQLDRSLSTVRRWIRAVRDPAHVEWLRAQGVEWLARVDRDVVGGLRPEATRLGEALTALAAAAVTLRARVVPGVPAWTLIGQITHSRLLTPAAPGLRSHTCRVLARPQPDATATTPESACAPPGSGTVTTTPATVTTTTARVVRLPSAW